MKRVYLLFLVLFGLVNLNASAVIFCNVKAEVVMLYTNDANKNARLLVHSAVYSGGHSAGNSCPISKGQEVEVKLSDSGNLKLNKIYNFEFRRVFNFTNEGKGVVYNNWELK